MGAETGIEWCHHTFNPWRGCEKVSPGCANCYAETLSKRNPAVLGVWGANGTRAMAAESYWRQPVAWNREAKTSGERRRVFCASLADVFEDRPDLVDPRSRLMGLIVDTPNLDWLLLTKRPENVMRLIPGQHWPPNVWLGTSVEDQRRADERIPQLVQTPAAVRFLSVEPMLAAIDIARWFVKGHCPEHHFPGGFCHGPCASDQRVDWVICGGESGAGARPMRPHWARSLRDQCVAAGVPFFFKQWGEWGPYDRGSCCGSTLATPNSLDTPLGKFGKKVSGRLLDGRTWDQFPEVAR